MRKEFNITGSCNPEWHYMVDTSKRFAAVAEMIERGKYFTINRARQFGKTTTLFMIWRRLSEQYLVLPMSFEGLGDSTFASEEAFSCSFARMMVRWLSSPKQDGALLGIWENCTAKSLDDLSEVITEFCQKATKPVVVTIDEVDKSSDNQRMDLVIAYGRMEFVVELKIWRGEKYEERRRDQLAGYLATRGLDEGYLVTFDFSKTKERGSHEPAEPQWTEHNGKRIFEVII